ncbi:hypothetical protein HKCCE3408_08005 [Rhodobacterales bacterium HKCCE3408]|nr:hypothetical protein [Rhodobacterales bacterium HKCCE3408]
MSRRDEAARLVRFVAVGGAFAGGYAVLTALLVGRAGLPAYATSVVLYALCIPAAFLVQKRVTFGLRRTHAVGFPVYAATQIACLACISAVTTRWVTGQVAIDTVIFLASAGAAALFSYLVSSRLAFRPPG